MLAHISEKGCGVGRVIAMVDFNVAVSLYLSVRVEHYDGNGVVAVYHAQHKIDVGVLIGMVERGHSLSPPLHLGTFLTGKVAYEDVRHNERDNRYHYGCQHKNYLHTAYLVYPLHINV